MVALSFICDCRFGHHAAGKVTLKAPIWQVLEMYHPAIAYISFSLLKLHFLFGLGANAKSVQLGRKNFHSG